MYAGVHISTCLLRQIAAADASNSLWNDCAAALAVGNCGWWFRIKRFQCDVHKCAIYGIYMCRRVNEWMCVE